MSVELAKNKSHIIIKRDGREEPYQSDKLWKVVLWACDNKETLAQNLIDSLDIKINNKMRIQKLYDELINTAKGNISDLYPHWDDVASKLLILKLYKETHNLKKTGVYPDYMEIVERGLNHLVYGREIFESFTRQEIAELGAYIKPDRDLLFTYKGLYIFNKTYCASQSKKVQLELPQHAYMRMAIFDFHNDRSPDRLQKVRDQYDYLSCHHITLGTPHAINGGTPKSQIASCVLSTTDDATFSINETDNNMALYSKYSGGLANDVSAIRAKGAEVKGNRGFSGGIVPFIQKFEKTVTAWNQGGKRSGSCVITYPFWHLEIFDLLPLKDAGGTEDKRARKLQYAMTMPELFKDRCRRDEDVTLFCPSDVPRLLDTYGDEWEHWYGVYEEKVGIRKRHVKAREILFPYLKYRQQTGNVYATFIDNINSQNITARYSGASNLCTEIIVPSEPSKLISQDLVKLEDDEYEIRSRKICGEIGLCNLASINLLHYWKMTDDEKFHLCYTLLSAMDNAISSQYYPVKEAKKSNLRNRPIGIGVLNFASLLAANKLKFTDEETKRFTHEVFEDLYYNIYKASIELAKERGRYEGIEGSLWEKGETPVSISKLHNMRSDLNFDYKKDWEELGDEIKKFGVRFSYHGAIAPTATSGKAINATESTEPIHNLFYVEEGTDSLPTLANNLRKHRPYYENAYSVPNKTIIELAAIRQKFLDQAQSINTYYVNPNSAQELADDLFLAMDLGLKTLYYLKTPKSEADLEICQSCT